MLDSLLIKVTKEFPNRNKTCIKNMLILVLGILESKTLCLNEIKDDLGKVTGDLSTQPLSHYKRLTRTVKDYCYSGLWLEILVYINRHFRLKSHYLILDGSSWQRGKVKHHMLTLCTIYQQTAIPIYFDDLRKKGNSNQKERISFFKKAKKKYHLENKILLADREYLGKKWFNFLLINRIDFIIRLKANTYCDAINQAEGLSYEEMKQKVLRSKKATKSIGKVFVLEGIKLQFVVAKNTKKKKNEPLVFFITNLQSSSSEITTHYRNRWKIECCFQRLKSTGFKIEKINVEGKSRFKLLMAATFFAYTIAIIEGLKTYQKVPVKQFRKKKSKTISVFAYGFSKIKARNFSFQQFVSYINDLFQYAKKLYKSPFSINV